MVQFAPIIITAAAAIGASASRTWTSFDPQTRKIIFWSLAGTAAVVGGRYAYREIRRANLLKQADNVAVQQATSFKQGIDPYGMFGFGTDEKLIMNTAAAVRDWNAVTTIYKQLYGSDLLTDLRSDLSADEYGKLMDVIEKGKSEARGEIVTDGGQKLIPNSGGGTKDNKPAPIVKVGYIDAPDFKGRAFVTNKEAYVFSKPDKTTAVVDSLSVTKIPIGLLIGYGTGRAYKREDGITMVELGIKYGSDGKEFKGYWANINLLKMLQPAEYKAQAKNYPAVNRDYIS